MSLGLSITHAPGRNWKKFMKVLYDFLKQPPGLDWFSLPGRTTENETRLLRVIQGDAQAILNKSDHGI